MSALATCLKIVEQGGIPAMYTGLVPSLLQVCYQICPFIMDLKHVLSCVCFFVVFLVVVVQTLLAMK